MESPFAPDTQQKSITDENDCQKKMADDGAGFPVHNSQKSGKFQADEFDPTQFFCNNYDGDVLSGKDAKQWEATDLVGIHFPTVEVAETFYLAYSRIMGFGVRRGNLETEKPSGILTMRRWVCSRNGRCEPQKKKEKNSRCVPVKRCSCGAAFVVRYNKKTTTYRVSTFNPAHNHDLANKSHGHFITSNRRITSGQKMEIRTMKESGIRTCQIMDFMVAGMGGYDKVGFTIKDLYNFVALDHERKNALSTDAESALGYLNAMSDMDTGLSVRYAVDGTNKLSRLLWADSQSKMDYTLFGDVVVIDSTYATNTFKMPLVEFVGVNNHMSSVVFACCLISDETIDSYEWAFRTFVLAMGERQPGCALTDGDKAIAAALVTTMPNTRHRLCTWHLMRNARVVTTDSNFFSKLGRLMRHNFSAREFEHEWNSFLEEFELFGNEWMEELYAKKEKWAEAFFKGVFTAGMNTSQRCEGVHSFMSRFLNCRIGLYAFVKQFCRATSRIRQRTLLDDFANSQKQTELTTHLRGLEQTAYNFYSRSVFKKVQREMMRETAYTPARVEIGDTCKVVIIVKYGDETGREINISIRNSDKYIVCPCGTFFSEGWPCRHMFCAMKSTNMTSIPDVLLNKRWSKNCSTEGLESSMEFCLRDPKERRFCNLRATANQICHMGSVTEEMYIRAAEELDGTINRLLSAADPIATATPQQKRRKHLDVEPTNILKDPDIVRTKGSFSETKYNKGKTRRCGICKQPGHYKNNCPILKDDTGSQIYRAEDMDDADEGDGDCNELFFQYEP